MKLVRHVTPSLLAVAEHGKEQEIRTPRVLGGYPPFLSHLLF